MEAGSHVYPAKSVLDAAGPAGNAPTWTHAWNSTVVSGKSVWMALVAALFIGAGIQTLVPKRAFTRVFASSWWRPPWPERGCTACRPDGCPPPGNSLPAGGWP